MVVAVDAREGVVALRVQAANKIEVGGGDGCHHGDSSLSVLGAPGPVTRCPSVAAAVVAATMMRAAIVAAAVVCASVMGAAVMHARTVMGRVRMMDAAAT